MNLVLVLFLASRISMSVFSESISEVKSTLQHAIELNTAFKIATSLKASDSKAEGKAAEDYYSKRVVSLLNSIPLLLASSKDAGLMRQILDFHASFENFADEDLGIYLAKDFHANPDLFESTYRSLSPEKRKIVYVQLEFGWENLMYGKKETANQQKLERRLKNLEK